MSAKESVETLSQMILDSERVVVFTGAGVSTESGIPDFRSPGGLWDRYDPQDFLFQRFMSSEKSRILYWEMHTDVYKTLMKAKPNPTHYGCVTLNKLGKLECVITQNIDNLHQEAGLPREKVIELHGNAKEVKCMHCGKMWPREEIQQRVDAGDKAPNCEHCQGYLKPATIAFGQSMPLDEMRRAEEYSRHCSLFIAMGSSLVVHPAAMMPVLAKNEGARLVIVTLSSTPYDGEADLVIHEKTGEVMSRVVDRVKKSLG